MERCQVSRLIVVSNRVNPPSGKRSGSEGGLAMALSAALRQYSGLWFGWSGETVPEFTGDLNRQTVAGVEVATVDLEETDYQEYYNGFANRTLWPLFHYRIDLAAFDRAFGKGYDRVNRLFAQTLAPLIRPGDRIWVHDYHLIPLARELRQLGVKNPIGFFLHIPWPARRLFIALPRHQQLVRALFDYDLIGFQTEDHLDAFQEYVRHEVEGRLLPDDRLEAFGRTVRARAYPIGIDAEEFLEGARSPAARRSFERVFVSAAGRAVMIGVDRLDYTKGLEERLQGYEQFLADHPDWHRNVFLLQVAPPSRGEVGEYQEIRTRLDGLAGRLNGAYADVDWSPIRYVNKGYRRDELAGMYRAARVGLVTPLRDGMNLVAKEFVAAQRPEDPGVLILSQFAGAALQLKDALVVNPYSQEDVADAIHRGLTMGKAERLRRWETLMGEVTTRTVVAWRDAFVRDLSAVGADPAQGAA
jgi:trehalose 6-phosphate synthase